MTMEEEPSTSPIVLIRTPIILASQMLMVGFGRLVEHIIIASRIAILMEDQSLTSAHMGSDSRVQQMPTTSLAERLIRLPQVLSLPMNSLTSIQIKSKPLALPLKVCAIMAY